MLITDDEGKVELDVPLADSITTWRLSMSAVTTGGELGAHETGVRVFQPFFIEPSLPVALTQNDVVTVPVAVFNYLDEEQTVEVRLDDADWLGVEGAAQQTVRLAPREVKSAAFRVRAERAGEHRLRVSASAGELGDAVERVVTVEPDGERVDAVASGELKGEQSLAVSIPDEAIDGSEDLVLKIYPGALSQVVEGMEGVFRMPNGCFEQTSSTTYPSLLVLDYMKRTNKISPELRAKAERFIQIGYQRLLSFEVQGGGFEWFGKSPAHPVLTAYGLMEFHDMKKVQAVDAAMIERTQQWLLQQQRHDGMWTMADAGIPEGATQGFDGHDTRITAYIAWALAESGVNDARLSRALDQLAAASPKDSYTAALIANALHAGGHAKASQAIARLGSLATTTDGKRDALAVEGRPASPTEEAPTLATETTALATLVLLAQQVERRRSRRELYGWLTKQA